MNRLKMMRGSASWAILPEWFSDLLSKEGRPDHIEILLKKPDRLLLNSHSAKTQNNLAVLPLTGVILPTENVFSQLWGATTLDQFNYDFQQALDNPAISEIILHIDSPGGMVTGVHECAEMIYQARGKKPMTAYVSGLGASAAYWLASACDEIVLDATASVGSIGVLSIHTDDKAQKEKSGLTQTQIVSSQSPRKRLDVTTDEGRADIQAHVDAIADVFVANVARNRNVNVETVLSDFGQGSLCVGIQAVKQGLADRLGSLQQLIHEKTAKRNAATQKLSYPPPREQTMTDMLTDVTVPKITADYLIEYHADCVNTFYVTGARQERARIQAVENQLIPGHEALIQQLKFDGKTTGSEAAVQVLAAEKARQSAKLTQLQGHALEPLPIARSIVEERIADSQPQKVLSTEEQWKVNWERDNAAQAEFGCFETYAAFMRAEKNGQINVLNRSG